jgi:biopolymer transport protein ExbD
VELNLVPLMDALVTIIIFLVVSNSFIRIAEIQSPAPLISHNSPSSDEKQNPIQLTVWIEKEQLLLEAGMGNILNEQVGLVEDEDGKFVYDFEAYRQVLVNLKMDHPDERTLILKPDPDISYDTIIKVIDMSRFLQETDPPLYIEDESGIQMKDNRLFPQIVFGNTMS